ncbi:CD109 antigen [Penaeus vannamei]|uniref:CD109 antigen n=1 Tax=Penaeus vannamei TaxID=6689 RepID=UPI00387F649C
MRINTGRIRLFIFSCMAFGSWLVDAQDARVSSRRSKEGEASAKYGRHSSRRLYDESISTSHPSYIVVAPRLARPSTVYRIVVGVFTGDEPVDVSAHMYSQADQLLPAHARVTPGDTQELLIKIPDSSVAGSYTLSVEGRRSHALVFRNSSHVSVDSAFLSILIHLSRPCFTGGQEVGIRVVMLSTELTPYEEPIDVLISDPQGNIVKRWISRAANVGVVSVTFELPELPPEGWWSVRVIARGQREEKKFLVHKIYEPLFEVFVEMPYYGLADAEEIEGTVTGSYLSDKPVSGNASLTLYVKQPWTLPDAHFERVSSQYFEYVDVEEDFAFPMESLLAHVEQLEGAEVKVECEFHDVFTWIKAKGSSRMRIIANRVHLDFVGSPPFVFRPGMPFHATVSARYVDGEPLEAERLADSSLVVTATVGTKSGGSYALPQVIVPSATTAQHDREEAIATLREALDESLAVQEGEYRTEAEIPDLLDYFAGDNVFAEYKERGIFRFQVNPPADAVSLSLDVVYSDSDYQGAASAQANPHYSPGDRYIQVTSSTHEAKVGEFAVFHVRTNFHAEHFVYMIISKGVVIHSSKEVTGGDNVVTLSTTVGRAMAPRFTIFVYTVTGHGHVVADSISLPVQVLADTKVHLSTNQHKDHSKKTVELVVGAPPGSFYALTCQRFLNFNKQHPNALSHARIVDKMSELEPTRRSLHSVLHKSREGEFADRLVSLPSPSYGQDVLAAFQDAALLVLTDIKLQLTPGNVGSCNLTRGFLECGDGTCFRHHQLCDGKAQCANQVDEMGCKPLYQDFPPDHSQKENHLSLDSDSLFRLLRGGLILDDFDTDDVDWCNGELWIGHRGQEEVEREIAKTAEEWVLEAYTVHPEHGLSFTTQPIFFTGDPPFYILAEAPSVCRRGEQISIRVLVHNMLETTVQALLLVHDSDDYRFVHVESKGRVSHFHPRTSRGQHQHLLFIPGGSSKEVVFPLAVVKESGAMEVTVEAVSQVRRDSETLEIEVKPEGVPVRKHTSLVLDLRNRALVYEFLDVAVDESPIIPFSLFRRFLYGSPAGRISISGDVFGPILEGISVDHTEVFGGRHLRSTDGVAFNFGATLWTLHYLRLTNQLDMAEAKDSFEYLTVQLAGLMWRCREGGFSMWAFTPPNVWVTARVLNILLAAQHEDWENLLYIDPRIIRKGVVFLLRHQMADGGFKEEGSRALDSKAKKTGKSSSVPLTALVFLVLHKGLASLQGGTRDHAIRGRVRAARFLESQLVHLNDSYHVALTAHALTLMGSSLANAAAAKLESMMLTDGGMSYWSRTRMKAHTRRQETSQRAFLLPRELQEWDSHAVESTSYALLVLLAREGVTSTTERIMRWLNAVRDWDRAFMSTVDTVVAMEALAEYAFIARLRDLTEIECTLDVTSEETQSVHLSISNVSTASYHTFELENVWGHINLIAKGSGQAVAQLDVSWGVDVLRFIEQPHKKYFDLSVVERYHQFRNKSLITTTVCAQWLATEDSHTSHAALVEIEIPTGYIFFQPIAEVTALGIKENGTFPEVRNVHTTNTHVFWQFEYIPSTKKQCFSYDIQRWYPAANLTAVRSATIMELFAPEHFEMVMINATPLALLDICEVCGSYQCPYCPIYSGRSTCVCAVFYLYVVSLLVVLSVYARSDVIL